MKSSNNSSLITGVVLIGISALFTICLITLPFTYSYVTDNFNLFYIIGNLFYNAYGFSSILIPVFLLISGLSCFASKWNSKKTMILLTAIFPFFTAVITEKICRSILEIDNQNSNTVKLIIAILVGLMLIAIEVFGAATVAERVNQKIFHNSKRGQLSTSDSTSDSQNSTQNEQWGQPSRSENDINPTWGQSSNQTSASTEENKTTVFDEALANISDDIPYDDSSVIIEENSISEDEIFDEDEISDENENKTLDLNFNKIDKLNVQPLNKLTESNINDKSDEDTQENNSNPATVITVEEYTALTTPENDEIDENDEEELEWPDLPPVPEKLPPEYDEEYTEEETELTWGQPSNQISSTWGQPSISKYDENYQNNEIIDEPNQFIQKNTQNYSPYSSKINLTDDDFSENEEKLTWGQPSNQTSSTWGQPSKPSYSSKIDFDDSETENKELDIDEPQINENVEIEIEKEDASDNIFSQLSEQEQNSITLTSAAKSVFSDMDEDIKKENQFLDNKSTKKSEEENKEEPKKKNPGKKGPYIIPTNLLTAYKDDQYWVIDDATKQASENLKQTLSEFNIDAEITGIKKGPVVTMFEILPAPGVKLSKIVALQDNIALALAAQSVRIVAPIPGKQAVGIEVPNKKRSVVGFREIIEMNLPEWNKMAVPVVLGKDILGKAQLIDLVKTPHMLIAGATGSGKSVCVNSLILSILYKRSYNDVKLILVDPKVVELKLYNNIPHLLTPVITEPKKALQALQWCLCEMERRYSLLDSMGVRDISNYNIKIKEKAICTEKLPYIVVIIDEFADLMATSGKELENIVARLTAMSRAVGIHLVLATQRPSVNVITGLIKANIPSRIAFMVASRTDSNIIIDSVGAEKLLGRGDMLYASAVDPYPVRIQGTFVSDQEVENTVLAVKEYGEPDYIDEEIFVDDDDNYGENVDLFGNSYDEDPLYEQALDIVVQAGKASASYIQRKLKIGYNRAARLVEEMEERGIVGPANGSKPREIIHIPN